jgi:hypothetical protein
MIRINISEDHLKEVIDGLVIAATTRFEYADRSDVSATAKERYRKVGDSFLDRAKDLRGALEEGL